MPLGRWVGPGLARRQEAPQGLSVGSQGPAGAQRGGGRAGESPGHGWWAPRLGAVRLGAVCLHPETVSVHTPPARGGL